MSYSLAGHFSFFDFLVSLEDPTWQLVKICSTCKLTVCCASIFQKGLPHIQVLCYKSIHLQGVHKVWELSISS
jgi:hypothetical protein